MRQLTIRVPDETLTEIEELASEQDVSKSEVARKYLERGSEYDRLQTDCDRLERQLQAANDRYEEHSDLVRYAEKEKTWREANLLTRAKWWFTGIDD